MHPDADDSQVAEMVPVSAQALTDEESESESDDCSEEEY